MKTRYILCATLLAGGILTAPTLFAQTAPEGTGQSSVSSDDVIELSPFEVTTANDHGYFATNSTAGTRTDQSLRDTPQSIYILTDEFIRDIAADSLDEILDYAPEVEVGGELDESPSIRGFRISDPQVDGFSLGNKGRTSTANIDRVEVLAGPSAIFYSNSFGIGGAINQTTKKPIFDHNQYSVTATVRSFDYYRGVLDASGPLTADRHFAYRMIVEGLSTGNFQDFAGTDKLFLASSVGWRPNKKLNVNLAFEYTNQTTVSNFVFDYVRLGKVIEVPRSTNARGDDDRIDIDQYVGRYQMTYEINENWSLRHGVHAVFVNKPFSRSNPKNAIRPDERNLIRGPYTLYDRSEQFYATQLDLAGKFSTGPIAHRFVMGGDLQREMSDEYVQRGDYPNGGMLDLFTPDYEEQTPGPLSFFADNYLRTDTWAVYVYDQMAMFDERLLLSGGVRASNFEQENRTAAVPEEIIKGEVEYTPRFGALFKVTKGVNIYYTYAETFNVRSAANPDGTLFPPDLGVSNEVGAKLEFLDGRISVDLALYAIERQNLLQNDPDRSGFKIPSRSIENQGFSITPKVSILDNWQVFGNYEAKQGEYTDDLDEALVGEEIGSLPGSSYRVWTKYRFVRGPLKGLGIGGGMRFMDTKVVSNASSSFEIPSYRIYDVNASYRYENLSFTFNVKNATDEHYYTFGGPTRLRGRNPREYILSVRCDF